MADEACVAFVQGKYGNRTSVTVPATLARASRAASARALPSFGGRLDSSSRGGTMLDRWLCTAGPADTRDLDETRVRKRTQHQVASGPTSLQKQKHDQQHLCSVVGPKPAKDAPATSEREPRAITSAALSGGLSRRGSMVASADGRTLRMTRSPASACTRAGAQWNPYPISGWVVVSL